MTSNMHIISEITPYYIQYKNETKPVECIVKMWEIGKILDHYIKETGIKPHTLFRDLYGKSETSTNTQQKSYISREFQGRCYRVFHMFSTIEEIKENLGNLKNITIFREAMPFFDNPDYKMDRTKLYSVLLANKTNSEILDDVRKLQKNIIGKKNPRTQRLHEMDAEVEHFKEIYAYILSYIRIQDFMQSTSKFASETALNDLQVREIAKNTEQLALSNVRHVPMKIQSTSEKIANYINMLENLLNPSNIKQLRRFKRLVDSKYILLLTDMLYALADEESYQNLVKKLRK